MTEPSTSGAPWRPPTDLAQGPLAGAAVRLVRAAPGGFWTVMAVLLGAGLAMDVVARRLGVPLDATTLTAATWVYVSASAAVSSALVGVALHVLLTGRAPRRLDAGFLGFVLWSSGGSLLANGVMSLIAGAQAAPPAELLPRFLAVAVLGLGGFIVLTRLLLLPTAWLVSDPGATLAGAWGRMRGQLAPYILASILLTLPVVMLGVLAVGAAGGSEGEPSVAARVVTQVMATALAGLSAALNAVIYLRLVGAPQRLAEVFD